VTGVFLGAPLIAAVSAVAPQPWQVAERAAIGAACWALVAAAFGSLRTGQYSLYREPIERLAPRRSGFALMAAEALIKVVVFGAVGAIWAHFVLNAGVGGLAAAWGLGIPLGASLGELGQLHVWEKMARREHGSLWVSARVLASRHDRRKLFVITDSEPSTIYA